MRTLKPVVRKETGKRELEALLLERKRGNGRLRLQHLVVRDFDFSGRLLPRAEMYDLVLEGCRFTHATVTHGILGELLASRADFREVEMDDVDIVWSVLRDTRWDDARLVRTCFTETDLSGASFRNADLTGVSFTQCDLTRADFTGAVLSATQFEDCRHIGTLGLTDRHYAYEPAMFSQSHRY